MRPQVANPIAWCMYILRVGPIDVIKGQRQIEGMTSVRNQAWIKDVILSPPISRRKFVGPAHLICSHTVAPSPRCAMRDHGLSLTDAVV